MTTYGELKNYYKEAVNRVLTQNNVFFAFSQERLEKHKAELGITNNDDLSPVVGGGFIQKKLLNKFLSELDQADKDYKEALKKLTTNKKEAETAILYELNNHECFYTSDLEPVFGVFYGIFTKKTITDVFNKELKKHNN